MAEAKADVALDKFDSTRIYESLSCLISVDIKFLNSLLFYSDAKFISVIL